MLNERGMGGGEPERPHRGHCKRLFCYSKDSGPYLKAAEFLGISELGVTGKCAVI